MLRACPATFEKDEKIGRDAANFLTAAESAER
jgi:hypothetical protein